MLCLASNSTERLAPSSANDDNDNACDVFQIVRTAASALLTQRAALAMRTGNADWQNIALSARILNGSVCAKRFSRVELALN